ncbi:sensor histidine kinase [Actinoallomurus purpureus]|uniref:sensor histidine kinase n=1 Tax=Actinoallomurus purpureus TaxID=478114 RepID=UPI0020928D77|nr:sensor histidine kinase [Actinoallomurus purpureus]MCO6009354.1 sensor histidine kinase [Actinoallomurus purpureus]
MNLLAPQDADRTTDQPRWRRLMWMSLGLVYLLIWPLGDILRHGGSAARISGLLAALLSFVVVFIALAASNHPATDDITARASVLLAIATAMAIGYPVLFGSQWIGLCIYLGVGYAMVLPSRWAVRGVVAATALTAVLCMVGHAPGATLALLTFETLTIGLMMLGFRASRMLIAQLQEARGEVARLAANEERLRIARDLHDLLGHTLSLIVLKSEVAVRIADRDPAKSLGEMRDIETVARQALTDVRAAVSGYRRRSLAEELDNARGVLAAADIEPSITTSGTPLTEGLDELFAWAVREGVTNVVRHSRARTAGISVTRRGADAVLQITDDGSGPAAGDDAAGGCGNGLAGLGERVARAGGSIESGPTPHGGFRLIVRAPLDAPPPSA